MKDRNQALLDQKNQHYASGSLINFFNIVFKQGRGAMIEDVDGNQYIDFLASASSTNTGHCHPHVVKAIQEQAARLIQYTPAYFATEPEIELAKRLTALAPISGETEVAWGNSGSAANDAMIKFARAYTKRQYVVTFTGAYHGSSFGALSMSAVNLNMTRQMGPLLPGIIKVPFPNSEERLSGETEDEFADRMFALFKQPFETYLPVDETALINIEAIQGDGGFVKVPQRYMELLAQFAKDHGIVFAVDEVNQGMGRTGKWWSIQNFPGIEPDMIAVGKSLASGMPLSAVVARKEIMEALNSPGNTYTTAGNPVVAAAANATLDVIENEHLVEQSARLGEVAKRFFLQLQQRFAFIGDVRMYGLNGGITIIDAKGQRDDAAAAAIITRLCERGVLMITVRGNVLRFQPPLVIEEAQLDKGLRTVEAVLQEFADGKLKLPEHKIGW